MKKANVGIVTPPAGEASKTPLSNLVDIVICVSNDSYLITGNVGYRLFKDEERLHTYGFKHERGANTFTRILKYIYIQLRISYELAKIAKKVDLWIFFLEDGTLLLPMLTAKFARKKVILNFAGSAVLGLKFTNDKLLKPIEILINICCNLPNRIILYSPNLIKEWNLEKYQHKISIAHEHFLDFDKFKIKRKFDGRNNIIGYIGRLSEEKGVLNFVKAILTIIEEKDDLEFLICGDGLLRDEIEKYIKNENLDNKVKLAGWIPHDKLPNYLNKLKLLVIPSYTESGPIIALEAMACGTPILATRTGHVLEMIKDGENGFIMENNSHKCIAKNVIRALEQQDMEQIIENANTLVKNEFTYGKAVEGYKKALNKVLNKY